MDEEIAIIDAKSRNEKIKNFFINNKKRVISIISIIILLIIAYFAYIAFLKSSKIKIAEKYNKATINFILGDKENAKKDLIEIINKNDKTYSILSLYFIIDNDIVVDVKEVNQLFDLVINKSGTKKEIKNLIIFKKALFNSDFESESNLIEILNPLINSKSIWKSHALYLMAEYFYFKNEKQKSKEFFNEILILENSNLNIKTEAQKRLNRDFSE
ncbi:hypothetical protein OAP67_00750 [Candidatus Pelagibacter sp.]|nr:hypothetical protein [Candidatus Pelagibacter sp.]